MSKELVIE